MAILKESLTFDDVTLVPQFSSILPSEASVNTSLAINLNLKIPFISSAMDTVTESKMAIAMAKEGGLGIIHRNLNIKRQCREVLKVKNKKLIVGAAIGTADDDISRANKLLENGVDLLVIDTAHGHSKKVLTTLKKIKKISKKIPICAGNIATSESAKALANEGADIIKVGIGPGSICTTRIVSGIGVPQISAVIDVKKGITKNKKVKIISDGGVKFLGDAAKAIAAGADAVMMGSVFAGTEESPGKKFKYKNKFYKSFRGMGSIGAMMDGSSGRYFQKNYKDRSKFVPEGVEGRVIYKGKVNKILYQLKGGLKSSMGYIGAKDIKNLQKKSKFVKITKAGFYESMVHNVDVTNDGNNYKI
tara:strand:- start:685 stop:1767 length:1083 start_codon:yes stop_codon:yes gene_type:complete